MHRTKINDRDLKFNSRKFNSIVGIKEHMVAYLASEIGIDLLKILYNKLNIKNIGTKTNMSDKMVCLAMFITKLITFISPHKIKTSPFLSVFYNIWNLGLF